MMNSVNIIGRMVDNIDFRTTRDGKSVANFAVAVNRGKDREADFIRCVAWENAAELMRKYTRKGEQIGITGHIQTRQFEAKEGGKRRVTEVIVESITLLSQGEADHPKPEAAQTKPEAAQTKPEAENPLETEAGALDVIEIETDGNLPF